MKFATQYQVGDGRFGLALITESGRCYPNDRAAIERDVCSRYELIAFPNAAGAVFKALDGRRPRVSAVTPPTMGKRFDCVKVSSRCTPHAAAQGSSSPHGNVAVLRYTTVWQEVNGTI